MSLVEQLHLSPETAGVSLSPEEFDAADFEPGYRYELIHGVVVVSPATSPFERGPNELLGYLLHHYSRTHPNGSMLDGTLHENDIFVGDERRRADRVMWTGLGRTPRVEETPTIAVEFVSEGKRNLTRDYVEKRREYAEIGVLECWVFNRFTRTMTVYEGTEGERVLQAAESYTTALLPGFELPLAELFEAADRWDRQDD